MLEPPAAGRAAAALCRATEARGQGIWPIPRIIPSQLVSVDINTSTVTVEEIGEQREKSIRLQLAEEAEANALLLCLCEHPALPATQERCCPLPRLL